MRRRTDSFMGAKLKAIPSNYGTLRALAKRTGLGERRLYRLRLRGVFRESLRLNNRAVYYDISACAKKIQRYMKGLV